MDPEQRASLQKRAAEDVAAAIELVKRLQHETGERAEAVRSALPTCSGVAFMFVSKFGLGLGVNNGRGFVIHRLPVDEAGKGEDKLPNSWSAPLFFSLSGAGVGLTVGIGECSSLVALQSRQAVTLFAEKQVEMKVGAKAALGSSGEALPGDLQVLGGHPFGDKSKVFSVVSGILQLDLSINWSGMEPWEVMNRACYGSGHMDPRVILHGEVEAPSGLKVQDLYASLGDLQ